MSYDDLRFMELNKLNSQAMRKSHDDHDINAMNRVHDHKKLLLHISTCTAGTNCGYPRCVSAKSFIKHCRNCKILDCRVCVLARNRQNKRKESMPHGSYDTVDVNPLQKRLKIHQFSQSVEPWCPRMSRVSGMDMDTPASPAEGFVGPNDGSGTNKMGAAKPEKAEACGVSLIEVFSPEQVREHIKSLKQGMEQSKPKTGKNYAVEQTMSDDPCQLCGMAKVFFEPVPVYCTLCGSRVKRSAKYYTAGAVDARRHVCSFCFVQNAGESLVVDGTAYPKAEFEKQRNDKIAEEGWVQCDKCPAWQHQICALFNSRRNEGGQGKFTCPICYIAEVERGERSPLQQSAVLGAKDLPRTSLSDHLEQRLLKKLKQERVNRARIQGKNYDEVPGAEGLVVRDVSSVDKTVEVKKRFSETFKEVNYPNEFAYKSKVVLLFQKIEGVDVCLFAMIVQEYGADCQQPNHRHVNLSYMDSVKYFKPEIKAVTGEDLRTFVYHEILIGYLEHCKTRGFTSCYIWACPPIKGDDYIFYCHPETQKTPKSDKLRDWYLTMLEKAAKENIVVEITNLYDHFFVSDGSTGECKAKVTAARLPYYDGDYLPGASEDFINLIACGQSDLSGNATKDVLLMHKLGEAISPKKEDFIIVHLQNSCSHCCTLIASGNCWSCCQCKNFRLCDKCYEAEQKLEKRDRHPINKPREIHIMYPVEVSGVPADTQDNDEILECKFFDTRLTFLGFCEGNHYQYDTLRRAKHSSMMLLYHLHNPNVPEFVPLCQVCRLNIETGQGWHCETCPDYNMCSACYKKDGESNHPHKLTQYSPTVDLDAQKKEAKQQKVSRMRKMHDLLVHAIQCQNCPNPGCHKMKGLLQHAAQCITHETGGCFECKRIWYLFKLHAAVCPVSQCHVPYCRGLKERMRRKKEQADSRDTEGMRQLSAEVSGVC
nr:PREDICTED: histone acetyltransferase HAC1-like [Daucus carota subsp. sativus]